MDLDLTPRTVRFGPGQRHATSIAPSDFTCARLVAELADGWLGYHHSVGSQSATTANRSSIIRRLGRYLSKPEDRSLSLTKQDSHLLQRLHDWERHLITESATSSHVPKKHGLMVRKYVLYYLTQHTQHGGLLRAWAAAPYLDGQTRRSHPLDEFGNDDRVALERTCRQVVRRCESLLSIGSRLLVQGQDPRNHGWDEPADVLWGLVNLPDSEVPYGRANLLNRSQASTTLDQRGIVPHAEQVPASHPLLSLLVPPDHYATAVRVLLHLRTGWTPEESRDLTLGDLEFTDTHVRVQARKLRTPRVRTYELPSRETEGTLGWSAGDLLRRAKQSLERAHTLAGDGVFWIGAVRLPRTKTTIPGHRWLHHQIGSPLASLRSLATTYGLELTEPYDLRRLRKTVKSARALVLGTLAGAAGDDHTVEVFRNHYAHSSTVHTISAATVLRAQEKALRRAVGPILVPAQAADITTAAPIGPLEQVADQVASESQTDRQLTISGCTDPYAPPHRDGHQLCQDAPSMCLRCPNAIVFADHIPRLLAYRQILQNLALKMPPQQFDAVYGQQLANLKDILDRFPADVVDRAAATPARLHLPLSERASH